MNGRKFSKLVSGRVGEPLTSKPNLNRQTGEWVINDIEQPALDGHGGFPVGVTGSGQEQNLGWDANVEFNRGGAWHVILGVVDIA